MPQAARDPIIAAAQGVLALQSIVARSVDPTETAVVTVGSIQGGSATNIIPDRVRLMGTLRSYSDDVRQHLGEAVDERLLLLCVDLVPAVLVCVDNEGAQIERNPLHEHRLGDDDRGVRPLGMANAELIEDVGIQCR